MNSLAITSALSIQNQRAVESPKPCRLQDGKIMKVSAKVLFALGAAIAAASLILAFTVNPLLACGLILAITCLGAAVLLNKEAMKSDPAELQRLTNEAMPLSFNQLISKFGWERTFNSLKFDKSVLKAKFADHVRISDLPYAELEARFQKLNQQYHFYDADSLRPVFLDRLKRLTLAGFINNEGGQYSFKQLLSDESGLLLQLDEVRAKFKYETPKVNLKHILDIYSWDIFRDHMADPADYRQEITTELHQLKGGLADFLKKYSDQIISQGILPADDAVLKEKFVQMLRQEPFQNLAKSELLLPKYGLVPKAWQAKVKELKAICNEFWNSDECHAAKRRYEFNNAEFFYHTVYERPYNSIGGAAIIPRLIQVPNPYHYPYASYAEQIRLDDNVRRPERLRNLVEKPWQQFLQSMPAHTL